MKIHISAIITIYLVIVQFTLAHTFLDCPKQDKEIRFKKNSILYLKNFLNDPDFSFENFKVSKEDIFFHLMPNSNYPSLNGEVCKASYTDSNGKLAVGYFNLVLDKVTHFLPGYNKDGDLLNFRGNYQNKKKHGLWEYYYTNEKYGDPLHPDKGYHKGELKSFGFYNNGERDGVWFEFPIRSWHRPLYILPAIISYKNGKKHGPFVNAFGSDTGEHFNDEKHGLWTRNCLGIGGTGLCTPDIITEQKNYIKGILWGYQNYYDEKLNRRVNGIMVNGIKEGLWQYGVQYPAATPGPFEDHGYRMMGYYKEGLRDGFWRTVHTNGRNRAVGTYIKGQKEGLWVYSHRNGEIASKINYKENIPEDGYHIIYETAPDNEDAYTEGTILKGQKEGIWLVHRNRHFDGNKEAMIMSNEYAKQYWKNGVLISEEITDSNYEKKN